MAQYTNKDIKLILSTLRSKIRNGQVTLYFRSDKTALRKAVASAFGFDADAFNTENFNPQTLKRFATLFDIPVEISSGLPRYPSNDDAAWALQNFINRRADPWSHVRPDPIDPAETVSATEADPIASLVQSNG